MAGMSDTAEADFVLVNAQLWSPGHSKPWKGAIALGGGKIVRVASNERCESAARDDATIIDIGGQMILPGFIDAHAHMIHTGPRMKWLQLQEIGSLRQLLTVVGRRAKAIRRDGSLLGRGWDESKWPERRYPTRTDLDRAAGGIPVLLRRVDGHMCIANTAMLSKLGLPRNTPGFEIDAKGRPTGALKKKALELAGERIRPSVEELHDCFPQMMSLAHSLGITSIHDIVDERGMEAYQRLHRSGMLGLRVYLMPMIEMLPQLKATSAPPRFGDEWLRFGAIKAFSDGSLGARTAALHEPYSDDAKERGNLVHRGNALKKAVSEAHEFGFQLGIHTIGDRAIDTVIDAYESALDDHPSENHRHRIEHFELPTDEALERGSYLGILPVMQPNFVVDWSQPGGLYEARLGRERMLRNNPHKLITRHGLRLAFSSDGMPYGPIHGLQGAVNPPCPDQKIPLHKALEAYTLGGAFASFEEGIKGRLAPGYLADLVVVDGSWDGGKLERWRVTATIVGGRLVYKIPAERRS